MAKIILTGKFASSGGTRVYFKQLLDFYKKRNDEVLVLLYKEYGDEKMVEYINNLGFSFCELCITNNRIIKNKKLRIIIIFVENLIRIKKIIKKFKPDLFVVSDWSLDLFFYVLFFSIKSLNIVHTYPLKKINIVYRILLRCLVSRKKQIVTVSNFSRQAIIDNWFNNKDRDDVAMIYNTVVNKNDNNENCNKNIVLTLGHVTEYKNPELWFSVAKSVLSKVNNIKFVWAGEGPLLEYYQDRARKINQNNIEFIGYCSDVSILLNDSILYFHPSKQESFCFAVLEAMSFGVPCIVSNQGALPELVSDNISGYVLDCNVLEMSNKILNIINDNELLNELGLAGQKRYLDFFSINKWFEEMNDLHDAILEV